jgi:hypothetical protein
MVMNTRIARLRAFLPAPPAARTAPLLLGALFSLGTAAAFAADHGARIAAIDQVTRAGLQREIFALDSATEVRIRAEGLADRQGTRFLAYGWILDLSSRQPAWHMDATNGEWDRKTENWKVDDRVTLPPGTYALYYAAFGGSFPLDKDIRFLGLMLGRIETSFGPTVKWNEHGDDSRWGIRVDAVNPGVRPARVPSEVSGPDPGALIRFFDLPNDALRRERIDLAGPVDFRVRFTGEYDRNVRAFADGAWITNLSTYDKVWSPTFDATQPAGGDPKNRMFLGTVPLAAGSYLLTVTTDGSHAVDSWNAPPPYDPEAWGISLTPVRDADRGFVRVTGAAGLPEPALAIRRVGDNEFRREPFVVAKPVRLFVHALGERSGKGEMADFAWIERADDLQPVWEMREEDTEPAGGSAKNRVIESVIELPPGSYALCYATDDSHSYPHWNSDAPRDPEDWGVSLAPVGPADPNSPRLAVGLEAPESAAPPDVPEFPTKPDKPGKPGHHGKPGTPMPPPGTPVPPPGTPVAPISPAAMAALFHPGEPPNPPAVIAITRVPDDSDLSRRFRVTEKTKFHLVALGEGTEDPLSDHGWIEEARTGKVIWKMRYRDTEPAGGARKNRIVRAEITLPKGEYLLRYESDDSHAFGDWNMTLPSQPQLWGISLVEVK